MNDPSSPLGNRVDLRQWQSYEKQRPKSRIVRTNVGSVTDEAFDASLQPDGRIVAAGRTDGPGFNRNFGVARYESDGDLDPSFGGGNGLVMTDLGSMTDLGRALAHARAFRPTH